MSIGDRELTTLQITAVASDSVLTRVVVLLGTKGARVRDVRCTVEPAGLACIWTVVETAPGRGSRLVAMLERVVDVLYVERMDPTRQVVDRVSCAGLLSSERR